MSIPESILDNATARHGAAEVFSVASERRYVNFEANRAKDIGQSQSSGVALRIIDKSGRIGFASTTDAENMDVLVERAGDLARYGSKASFEFPDQRAYAEVECYDAQVEEVSDAEMISVGESFVDRVRAEFPEALCEVSISKAIHEQRLLNSAGADIAYRQSGYGVSVGVELIRGTDLLSVWDGLYSGAVFGTDSTDAMMERILEKLRLSERIVEAPSGKDCPVAFTPMGFVGAMLPPLLSGFDGRNVATGSSPLIGRWGEKMLDERVTIFDDPLHPLTAQSHPVDDEGVPARRVSLVERGSIGEPILDLQTAGELGMSPTGSGLRGLSTTPSPSTSFLVMPGDDASSDDICEGVQRGIMVDLLLGAGQGNELSGDFRANVSLGFLIEDGQPVGRIKDTMISGNVYRALNEVEAVSSHSELVFGTRRAPAVRCRGVEVATSS